VEGPDPQRPEADVFGGELAKATVAIVSYGRFN